MPYRSILLESFRQLRNVRSLAFTFVIPLVMLLIFGSLYGSNGQQEPRSGLPWLIVTTVQMASYGGMLAALSQAFAITTERSIGWDRQLRITPLTGLGYLLSKISTALLIGPIAIWMWLLVVSLAAFINLPALFAISTSALVVLVQFWNGAATTFAHGVLSAPIVTAVGAAGLIGLGLISRSNLDLKVANEEIARLAVVEERTRFSRDLHDVLGHTLTVVTVKSELAQRLVMIETAKAEAEIADIERLTRSALPDLRLAVSNYRETRLDGELVAAKTALDAAGIESHLPESVPPLDRRHQGVFAWVLREDVTNVIRHSGATACWVIIGDRSVTAADDGRGPGDTAMDTLVMGNGLRGLRERSAEACAELLIGQSARGGFELVVRGTA